jgi:uncharacterized protein (DUF1330 family)
MPPHWWLQRKDTAMTAYCLFDVREIHDDEAMGRYRDEVVSVVESFGGRYVVVGGPWEVVEGEWRPAFPVMITFPDMAAAEAWYTSDAYRPLRDLRHRAVTADAVFFDSSGADAHAAHDGMAEVAG